MVVRNPAASFQLTTPNDCAGPAQVGEISDLGISSDAVHSDYYYRFCFVEHADKKKSTFLVSLPRVSQSVHGFPYTT